MFLTVFGWLRTRFVDGGRPGQSGQSTAEYALVILGAVAIATLLITWATQSHAITALFDKVITRVLP
jgi:hypothetical protein